MNFDIELDIKDFEAAARKLDRAMPDLTRREVGEAMMFEWLRRIILRWPVDTGRSRAAWEAAAAEIDTLPVGKQLPIGVSDTDAEALAEGRALGDLQISATFGGVTIIASNKVPYAVHLEDGSSSQAPAGAVAISLAELVRGRIPDEAFDRIVDVWGARGFNVKRRSQTRRARLLTSRIDGSGLAA